MVGGSLTIAGSQVAGALSSHMLFCFTSMPCHMSAVDLTSLPFPALPRLPPTACNKIRAKIKGLEELLPGMDGLAVVSSRPHLLGFSVRQNVSLKVSGLRALMKRERAGPGESRQEQDPQQRHQASATVGNLA